MEPGPGPPGPLGDEQSLQSLMASLNIDRQQGAPPHQPYHAQPPPHHYHQQPIQGQPPPGQMPYGYPAPQQQPRLPQMQDPAPRHHAPPPHAQMAPVSQFGSSGASQPSAAAAHAMELQLSQILGIGSMPGPDRAVGYPLRQGGGAIEPPVGPPRDPWGSSSAPPPGIPAQHHQHHQQPQPQPQPAPPSAWLESLLSGSVPLQAEPDSNPVGARSPGGWSSQDPRPTAGFGAPSRQHQQYHPRPQGHVQHPQGQQQPGHGRPAQGWPGQQQQPMPVAYHERSRAPPQHQHQPPPQQQQQLHHHTGHRPQAGMGRAVQPGYLPPQQQQQQPQGQVPPHYQGRGQRMRAPMSPGRHSRQPHEGGFNHGRRGPRNFQQQTAYSPSTTRRRFGRLSHQVHEFLATVVPTEQEVENRRRLVDFLQSLVKSQWPESYCEIYGSSASAYCLRGADIDACLLVDERAAEDMEFSDDEDMEFEYHKAQRVKPGEGRHAQRQWEERQEKLKAEREARKKARESKKAAEAEGDADADGAGTEDVAGGPSSKAPGGGHAPGEAEAGAAQPGPDAAAKTGDDLKDDDKAKKEDRPANIGQQNIVVRLGRMLKRVEMTDVLPLPRARVPIVKFKHPGLHSLACDVCINNRLALENTRLLGMYAQLDERVVQLARFVKLWAKRRNINSAYRGTLSSYAYVVLVIFYLQTRPTPLLPSLQQIRLPNAQPSFIDGHDCFFCKDERVLQDMGYGGGINPNTESIGQLLTGFFKYYAHEFNFKEGVVSIRVGSVLSKAEKAWTTKNNTRRDRYWWCIEDPFELTHNLGRVADRDSLYTMRGEFMRAHQQLSDGAELASVCERFRDPHASEG